MKVLQFTTTKWLQEQIWTCDNSYKMSENFRKKHIIELFRNIRPQTYFQSHPPVSLLKMSPPGHESLEYTRPPTHLLEKFNHQWTDFSRLKITYEKCSNNCMQKKLVLRANSSPVYYVFSIKHAFFHKDTEGQLLII